MKNTAGKVKRRGRKAPMSVSVFQDSHAKACNTKKGDQSLPKIN